jgi:hypothetical protein
MLSEKELQKAQESIVRKTLRLIRKENSVLESYTDEELVNLALTNLWIEVRGHGNAPV